MLKMPHGSLTVAALACGQAQADKSVDIGTILVQQRNAGRLSGGGIAGA
jgi:hypothetical protein